MRILLLFTLVPLIELVLILKIHGYLSSIWGSPQAILFSIGTILITGVVGAKLASRQGLAAIRKFQENLAKGEPPTDPLMDGIMILVGGALLLTPGYFTDIFGMIFLFPLSRRGLRHYAARYVKDKVSNGSWKVRSTGATGRGSTVFTWSSQSGHSPFSRHSTNRTNSGDIYDAEIVEDSTSQPKFPET